MSIIFLLIQNWSQLTPLANLKATYNQFYNHLTNYFTHKYQVF
jgi:hypothetical protein